MVNANINLNINLNQDMCEKDCSYLEIGQVDDLVVSHFVAFPIII